MPGKKKKKQLEPPEHRDEPMVAYASRVEPESWNGVRLPPKLGRFDFIHALRPDLESVIEARHGGGKYKARLYGQENTKVYLGIHRFSIPGWPLKDGEPIEPKAKRPKGVSGIKRQIRQTLAEAKLHDAEAERTKAESRRRRAEAAEQQKRKAKARKARLAPLKKKLELLKELFEKQYQREDEEEESACGARRRREREESRQSKKKSPNASLRRRPARQPKSRQRMRRRQGRTSSVRQRPKHRRS